MCIQKYFHTGKISDESTASIISLSVSQQSSLDQILPFNAPGFRFMPSFLKTTNSITGSLFLLIIIFSPAKTFLPILITCFWHYAYLLFPFQIYFY